MGGGINNTAQQTQPFLPSFQTVIGKLGAVVCSAPGPKTVLTSGTTLFTFAVVKETTDKTFLCVEKLSLSQPHTHYTLLYPSVPFLSTRYLRNTLRYHI